jgi:hypothetical protein
MAASTSQSDCQPNQVSEKQSSKGKAKAKPLSTSNYSQSGQGSNWDWTSLTDPSSCRIPPVFTKDGR